MIENYNPRFCGVEKESLSLLKQHLVILANKFRDLNDYHRFINKITGNHINRNYLFAIKEINKYCGLLIQSPNELILDGITNVVNHTTRYINTDDNFTNIEMQLNCITRHQSYEKPVDHSNIEEWFCEKSFNNGFNINNISFTKGNESYIKNNNVLNPYTFSGKLEVVDRVKFNHAIENGFRGARAKMCGFGLLVLS